MRRSIVVVLSSLVLTVSMVVVWPVAVGSVVPGEGIWTGASSVLAADETPEFGWYVVGESESGRPIYRHYGSDGWDSLATTDPWMWILIEIFSGHFWAGDDPAWIPGWVGSILINVLLRLTGERGDQLPSSSPPAGEPAIPDSGTPPTAAGGSCEVRFYHGTPTVKVKDTPSKAKPLLARADFWVQEDCSVRMELVWQAQLIKGWCFMLVATGTGTSTPDRVAPQGIEITGEYTGGTSAIDEPCPAKDCQGQIDWLRGGNIEAGQVGSYLSAASANVAAKVIEDGTLHVEPLTFETGYMTFNVKRLFAEPQEPPPEPKACPTD
jgi:hypothetical protein